MPHDIISSESALTDADPEIFSDPEPSSPSLVSQMKKAGRALVRAVRRTQPKAVLYATMAVGALFAPAVAMACDPGCSCSGVLPPSCGGGSGKNIGPLTSVSDPVSVANGNVFLDVTDYTTAGQNPLQFIRYYNSAANGPVLGPTFAATLGPNWRSNYDAYLQIAPATSPTTVIAERPDGQQITFTLSGSAWVTDSDVDYTLTKSGPTWTLTDHNDTKQTFNDGGAGFAQLSSVTLRNGYTQNLNYYTGTFPLAVYIVPLNTTGTFYLQPLHTVTDSYNRTLTFTYNSNNTLQSVTTPDTPVLTYGYTTVSGVNMLGSVNYNTSPATSQGYAYTATVGPNYLTAITDENGNTSAGWTYDSSGRAITSQNGGSLAANYTTLTFNTGGTTTVTNAFGVADTYSFTSLQNVQKVAGISRASTSNTAAATESFGYDTNGFMNSFTDWNGNQTTTVNNAQGNPTTINEAVGSSVARTTTVTYDPTWIRLPATVVTPGVTTGFTYDGDGNPLTRTDTDTTTNSIPYSTNGQTRTTTFTWNGTGQLTSVQLPRTDATVKTTFGYNSDGSLASITDPLSHVTNITAHTPGGYPETIVDPNSVTTTLGWDARLNLNTVTLATTAGNLITTYSHDPANNLSSVQLPDNSKLTFTRDTANRLTKITDLLSNTINYTLDSLGDVTLAKIKNSSGGTNWQDSATFDNLGRSLTNTDGGGFATTFTWDPNSNLSTVTPPSPSGTTTYTYDALNRLATKVDPTGGGTTTITLDAHDRPTNVKDPKGNSTAYARDGFGDATQLASPDSGTSVFTYDKDSNLTQRTLAGGQVANLTWDAKDRNLTVSFPADSTLNISKTWDQTTGHGFGIGRLTSVTDQAGSNSFAYDERANITNESRVITGVGTLTTGTTFDNASRVAGITYPSGTVVDYGRDTMGNVTGITAKPPGASSFSNVATSITYAPFGPELSLTFGNGITGAYGYDWAYRSTSRVDTATAGAVLNHTQGYYANSSLLWRHDNLNSANSMSFGYDAMDRMTGAASGTGGFGTYTWTWDANGNAATQVINGTTANFNLTSGTNQLASTLTAGTVKYYNNNANGNLNTVVQGGITLDTFNYNAANQVTSATGSLGASASYKYGFDGQRLLKSPPGTNPITYQYSRAANELLAENDLHGGQVADYIYMDPGRKSRPIGEINPTSGSIYFMHTDNLGTPQKATDASQSTVWSASYAPFGNTTSFTGLSTQSIRLPGQYFDPETGALQNGFRYYAAGITRYEQTDPIGLAAGTNTYQYVKGNPFKYTDRWGLSPARNLGNVPGQGSGSTWQDTVLNNPVLRYMGDNPSGGWYLMGAGAALLTGGGAAAYWGAATADAAGAGWGSSSLYASTYFNTTDAGASVLNITTNSTSEEAAAALEGNGYTAEPIRPTVTEYTNSSSNSYVIRPSSSAPGRSAADFTPPGSDNPTLKINFGPKP